VLNVVALEQPVASSSPSAGNGHQAGRDAGRARRPVIGTSAEGIDTAEDREKFDAFLESCGISRPKGTGVKTTEEGRHRGQDPRLPGPTAAELRHRRAGHDDRPHAGRRASTCP
jgi:carbamoyl-phosphate synthase large subunit